MTKDEIIKKLYDRLVICHKIMDNLTEGVMAEDTSDLHTLEVLGELVEIELLLTETEIQFEKQLKVL